MTGEERLRHHAETAYPYRIFQAGSRVRCIIGLGHSNSIAIEGDTSLILSDCLERAERLKKLLAEQTGKPVKTIIYTHGHPDHRGGSGAFRDTVEEIIMSSPRKPVLKYYDRLNDILNKRTARQFGYGLTDEECITQGIGIREGHAVGDGVYNFLPPTTYFTKDEEELVIDGVRLKALCLASRGRDPLLRRQLLRLLAQPLRHSWQPVQRHRRLDRFSHRHYVLPPENPASRPHPSRLR